MTKRAIVTVGDKLRKARLDKNLSQYDVAQAAGVRPEVVCRIETGKSRGALASLYKIAPVVGLTLDELVGDQTKQKQKGTKK
ncbi:MAG TPA: helix-turn-helix transcriptional regulator [Polyangiaceae bacterium]